MRCDVPSPFTISVMATVDMVALRELMQERFGSESIDVADSEWEGFIRGEGRMLQHRSHCKVFPAEAVIDARFDRRKDAADLLWSGG